MAPWIDIAKNGQAKTWLEIELVDEDVKVIHFYGIVGGGLIRFLDTLHEKLRWHSRAANLTLRIVDRFVSWPLLNWVPSARPSKLLESAQSEIQCRVFDTFLTLRWKQLAAYRYIKENYDFDFIYETNTSSYVDPIKLFERIKVFQSSNLYAGNKPYPEAKFFSGANRLMSRDALSLLVSKRYKWDPSLLEDVAIGKVFENIDVDILQLPSLILTNMQDVTKLTESDIKYHHHYRLKSFESARRNDVELMKQLHLRIKDV
jgi:hypothetical protein